MGVSLYNCSWLSKFRTCVNCCSIVGQHAWLCDACAPVFQEQKNKGWVSGYGFSVLSLYAWSTPLHLLNQRVAYSLKGCGPREIYFDAAVAMVALRLSLGPTLLNPVFVPSPRNTRLFAQDHAENFCEVLATIMGGQNVHALKRRSQSVHRRKTRAERELSADNRFELKNEKVMQNLHQHQGTIIFVDDLITTGSTARAAWLLLGRPQRFEVWTLLNKPSGSC